MNADTRRFKSALRRVAAAQTVDEVKAIAEGALNPNEAERRRALEASDARATTIRTLVRELAIVYGRLTFQERMEKLTAVVGDILALQPEPLAGEVSSDEVLALAGRGLASPHSLTPDEVQSVCASLVARAG